MAVAKEEVVACVVAAAPAVVADAVWHRGGAAGEAWE